MASEYIDKIPAKYREDIKKAADLLKNEGCKIFGNYIHNSANPVRHYFTLLTLDFDK
jgi:hypothetical protein